MHLKYPHLSLFKTSYIWSVVVDDAKAFNLTFRSLRLARIYKKALADSHRKLDAKIIKHQFMGDYIVEKREVA